MMKKIYKCEYSETRWQEILSHFNQKDCKMIELNEETDFDLEFDKAQPIIMQATFKIMPIDNNKITYLSVGGFTFNISNPRTGEITSVGFDFDAGCIKENEDGSFTYESGRGIFFNEFSISPDMYESIKTAGLYLHEITPKSLAATVEIDDFFVMIDTVEREEADFDIEISSISFYGESGDEFSVSKEVINSYHNKIASEKVQTLSKKSCDNCSCTYESCSCKTVNGKCAYEN